MMHTDSFSHVTIFFFVYSNRVNYSTVLINWVTYVQNIMQPSFVGLFNVVGPGHLPTMPMPYVEFYLYPTVGTVLIHSVKPELTE